jgi:copper(I)-binding protein
MEIKMKVPILVSALLLAVMSSASGHDYKVGSLKIDHPWSRATPKGASVAGGYMKITNTGATPDRLVGGNTEVAQKFELHQMSMDGGVMKMRELDKGLEIPPGGTIELKPGSFHVMMTGVTRPFVKGERVKASLMFEKAGKVDIEFAVDAAGGDAKEHQH